MAKFYFDMRNISGFDRDEVGDDFDSFDEARTQAQSLLPDIAREELPDGDMHSVVCDVRDETGRVVYRGEITYRGTPDPDQHQG